MSAVGELKARGPELIYEVMGWAKVASGSVVGSSSARCSAVGPTLAEGRGGEGGMNRGCPLTALCLPPLLLFVQVSGGVSMGFWPIKCSLKWNFIDRLWATLCLTPALLLLTLLFSALLVGCVVCGVCGVCVGGGDPNPL